MVLAPVQQACCKDQSKVGWSEGRVTEVKAWKKRFRAWGLVKVGAVWRRGG